jgi:acrylyl-CoA reductase (NADPH)
VSASDDPRWQIGDQVVIAGRGIGERRSGGYTTLTRQPGDILTRLPAGLTLADAMVIGTAGITAAMSVAAIIRAGITPSERPVLVTGASGGVGMHAIALLTQHGYSVTAVTGRLRSPMICAAVEPQWSSVVTILPATNPSNASAGRQ